MSFTFTLKSGLKKGASTSLDYDKKVLKKKYFRVQSQVLCLQITWFTVGFQLLVLHILLLLILQHILLHILLHPHTLLLPLFTPLLLLPFIVLLNPPTTRILLRNPLTLLRNPLILLLNLIILLQNLPTLLRNLLILPRNPNILLLLTMHLLPPTNLSLHPILNPPILLLHILLRSERNRKINNFTNSVRLVSIFQTLKGYKN